MVAVSTWACRIEKADALNKNTKMALFLMRRFTDLLCATGTELPFALVAAIVHRTRPVGPPSTVVTTRAGNRTGKSGIFRAIMTGAGEVARGIRVRRLNDVPGGITARHSIRFADAGQIAGLHGRRAGLAQSGDLHRNLCLQRNERAAARSTGSSEPRPVARAADARILSELQALPRAERSVL